MRGAWGWLVAAGFWHDVVGWAVFTVCTAAAAWWKARPWVREHLERQKRIADLLDTETPGGLAEVARLLRDQHAKHQPPRENPRHDHPA